MIKYLLRLILGTYTFCVYGDTEYFLNELSRDLIKIWDLCKKEKGCIMFKAYRKDFKKLELAANQTHTRIQIKENQGLPYILRNYRKRYGILIGGLLLVSIFYLFSLFIWRIDVTGCESVSKQEILTRLSDNGFETGRLKSSLDIKSIENGFLKNYDKISWISINLKGTVAYVEVKEVPREIEILDADEPSNIYASRDGVIASIESYMGYSVVKKGDTVTAGDLIVTGNYTDKYGVEYRLHSYAKVMAYTVHSYTAKVPYTATEHIRTGREKNKYSIKIIRFVIPLYFKRNVLYNNYDMTNADSQLKIADNFVLPISILKKTYTETETFEYTKSKDAALLDAYEQVHDFENDLSGIAILNRNYEEMYDDSGVSVKVTLECYEDIGISRKMD